MKTNRLLNVTLTVAVVLSVAATAYFNQPTNDTPGPADEITIESPSLTDYGKYSSLLSQVRENPCAAYFVLSNAEGIDGEQLDEAWQCLLSSGRWDLLYDLAYHGSGVYPESPHTACVTLR